MSHPDSKEVTKEGIGQLYVVATPIGNLADISDRGLTTLRNVDYILAEDTRHSKRLLGHYGINTRLRSCHEHNEANQVEWVAQSLQSGQSFALISDAGTPLISDPGFTLVRALREKGLNVATVPGASSIIAALSIAGLPTDSFLYDGFLPAKKTARQVALKEYVDQTKTVVLLESSHRIVACIESICDALGTERHVVLARELTKRFETVISGTAGEVLVKLNEDSNQTRGEFVLMLAGAPEQDLGGELQTNLRSILSVLIGELPVKQAAGLAAKITGARKNEAYSLAQKIKDANGG